MKKYLFISNSNKPSAEKINSSEPIILGNVRKPCVEAAYNLGYEIWVGVNRNNPERLTVESIFPINLYDSHTYRNIFNIIDNFCAYKNAMNLLKSGNFEVIHCNTPIGGIIGRICGKKCKIKKIIYTVHGFHFYKGAPIINNIIFKSVEFFLAHWTDVIITMNEEDYQIAKKMKLRQHGHVYKVNGVGITIKEYRSVKVNKTVLRKNLGLSDDDFICIAMGDLIKRKNYSAAIKAISKCRNSNIHYLICGKGPEEKKLKKLSKSLGINKQIHFLGFRTDIKELLAISDCFLFTSLQEGLPRSTMEAMASGLPCVLSDIRGNNDLIKNGEGGYLVQFDNVDDISNKICLIYRKNKLRKLMRQNNINNIKNYDIDVVKKQIEKIYEYELDNVK